METNNELESRLTMNMDKLTEVTATIVSISADIDVHTDYIVEENEVIGKLQKELDRDDVLGDDDYDDAGEVFGFSVGEIKGSTYKKILEMIIRDKKEAIEKFSSELIRLKNCMVDTISGKSTTVQEKGEPKKEYKGCVCGHPLIIQHEDDSFLVEFVDGLGDVCGHCYGNVDSEIHNAESTIGVIMPSPYNNGEATQYWFGGTIKQFNATIRK